MHDQLFNNWLEFNQTCPLCDIRPAIQAGPCQACQRDLPLLLQGCSRCARPGTQGLCTSCQQQPPSYSQVIGAFNYRFPMPQLIHRIKTGGDPEPLYWLSRSLADRVGDRLNPNTLMIPVPMHPWDQTLRGFNQSEILGRSLAQRLQLSFEPRLLRKSRRTAHQAGLNRAERLSNLQECFEHCGEIPEHLTLIDDVMTTGTTAERLAQHLLDAGCKTVEVCVLCRTPD